MNGLTAPCLHCHGTLTFTVRLGGWVHADGHVYKGTCHCGDTRHDYSHDDIGNLMCETWRDHHVATPDRSTAVPS